jgi:NtrC-family two-component system sensor histidine kinase KinB
MGKVGSPILHPTPSETQRQAQLYAVSPELNRLVGQTQTEVLRHLFTAIVDVTGVRSGRLFLADEQGKPEYCLVLTSGHLNEYDATSAPPLHKQGLTGWTYRQRRAVLIINTVTDSRWSAWTESQEESPAGSALAVPLLVADQPMGAIAFIADHPNHFTEADLALITNLADQAAIIIENIRLNTRMAQEQNTINALRQTARAINMSQDLDQILYTILNQLIQAVPHQGAMILLREDERLRAIAVTGSAVVDKPSPPVFTPTDSPAIFHALRQGRTIVADDAEQPIDLGSFTLSKPIRAWVIAPLRAGGETMGLVILVSHKPHIYNDQDISTFNAFADHIAIAVANHRLAQETDQRLRELAFLNETGQAITSTLNLDRILQLLLERVRDLLRIDAASIALRDEHTGELVYEAASGEGASGVLGVRLKPGQGIAGWVAETGKPLVVPDVYKDARFFPGIDKKTGMTTQAILCVPIVLKGHVVGIIQALNPDEVSFDEQALELLTALAGLAATAIYNARLFAQVRSAEARYEGLFEDSVNPIIITDLNGIIVDVNRNACSLLGQTKESLQGANLTRFRSDDGNLDFEAPHEQILSGLDVIFQTNILSNGHRTTIEIRGKQVPVKGITLIQWIGRDISAAIELEQTREDMVRMIIHDLRNPLANIMNSLDVLHEVIGEKDSSVSQVELLNIAQRSGQRLHQLISSILDISQLETGQATLETKPADLVPILHDAVEFVKPQADIREIRLTASFDTPLPPVEMDKDMIARVALNLLENAIKFTQVNGKVSIQATAQGDKIEVTVKDNGPGIPPDQLQNIFKKFVRVRRKDGPKGTGLGLAFCHLAIKAHGGRIWAESTLGQGSTFRFILPASPANKS